MFIPIGDDNRDRRLTPFVNYALIAANILVFVLLQGRHMYRLVCVAPSDQFARHLPAFQAMCGSFTPLGAIG